LCLTVEGGGSFWENGFYTRTFWLLAIYKALDGHLRPFSLPLFPLTF
jgi:hypothetical protein